MAGSLGLVVWGEGGGGGGKKIEKKLPTILKLEVRTSIKKV